MQLVVRSTETIKPSSATPHHLRRLKLSLLDQLGISAIDTRILLFYSSQGDVHLFRNSNMSFQLKKSLPYALAEFYLLAGRFGDDQHSIECDDGGVEYIEARVEAPFMLDQLLASPEYIEARVEAPFMLDQLLASPDAGQVAEFYPPLTKFTGGLCTIKVTLFEGCGSIVIGAATSHALGDASLLLTFVNSWAAIARGDKIVFPIFGYADVLPPRDLTTIFSSIGYDRTQQQEILRPVQKLITKRFVHNKSVIAALTANSGSQTSRLTRVQVVCALMFKCLIRVFRSKSSEPIFLAVPISWSLRISPPLLPNHVGNFAFWATPADNNKPGSFRGLVGQVREMSRGFNKEHIKNLLADDGLLLFNNFKDCLEAAFVKDEVQYLEVSSWCGVPFYEIDFGWGKPTSTAGFTLDIENLIKLFDIKDGGVEAWVTLNIQDMQKFVSEYQLILRDFGTYTRHHKFGTYKMRRAKI